MTAQIDWLTEHTDVTADFKASLERNQPQVKEKCKATVRSKIFDDLAFDVQVALPV